MKISKLNIHIIITILLIANLSVYAQQEQHYTQFQFNTFMYNPALAGTKAYYQAKTNFRFQWLKIVDSPRTYTLSVYGPSRRKSMGFGGYVFNDVTGPTSRLTVHLAYAYQFKIEQGKNISLGLSAGIMQYKIDGSKILLHDDNDPSLGNAIYTSIIPDANFGVFYYTDKYNFGISAGQLIASKINFSELKALGVNRLRPHIYAHGTYKYKIDDDWDVEPSMLIKYVWPTPPQLDLTVRGIWRDKVWAGIMWRTMDAVGFYIGYNYNDQLYFGYSYDYSTTNIQNYSSGTHELMITARFNDMKKKGYSSL